MTLLYQFHVGVVGTAEQWAFRFRDGVSRFWGQINDLSSGYAWLNGEIGGSVVWAGGSDEDPTYFEEAQGIEVRARRALRRQFPRDPWLLPEPIKDSMGWSFAMYGALDDDAWHDATGRDAKCERFRYLEDATVLMASPEDAAQWIIEQFEAPEEARSAICRVLEGGTLTAADVKHLAIGCSRAEVRRQLQELRYGESFVRP